MRKFDIISSILQLNDVFIATFFIYGILVVIGFWTGQFLVVFPRYHLTMGGKPLMCDSKLMHVNLHQEIRYFVRNNKNVYLFFTFMSQLHRPFWFQIFSAYSFLFHLFLIYCLIWHKEITKFQVNSVDFIAFLISSALNLSSFRFLTFNQNDSVQVFNFLFARRSHSMHEFLICWLLIWILRFRS